jgi:hypothetical protein
LSVKKVECSKSPTAISRKTLPASRRTDMEIKSDTVLRIKVGNILAIIGLGYFYFIGQPGGDFGYIPRWITLTALICLIVGYLLLLIAPRLKRKKDSEKINNMYLMTYGQKIPVDLSKCDVTENSSKTESVLVYKHSADEIFSTQSLPFDKNALSPKLQDKKLTFVYIDNKDRSKYFFDVDFVHE